VEFASSLFHFQTYPRIRPQALILSRPMTSYLGSSNTIPMECRRKSLLTLQAEDLKMKLASPQRLPSAERRGFSIQSISKKSPVDPAIEHSIKLFSYLRGCKLDRRIRGVVASFCSKAAAHECE
jgi:hypothetical protein